MINFIVCDDKEIFIKKINNVINKVMMRNNIEYEIHNFNDYNQSFLNIIDDKLSLKIYILDIETPTRSGIEIARMIRSKDIESMLIFLTAYYDKYAQEILKSRFMFLDFIDKSGDYEKSLENTIRYALSNINKKNIIRFKSNYIVYTIETKDILYIYRDKDRKCNIKTTYNNISISKSLSELYEMLDDRFEYSHRACIVNKDRIRKFDKSKKIIIFDDETSIDIVSTRFKMKS